MSGKDISGKIVGILAAVVIVTVAVLESPAVQTRLVHAISGKLENYFSGTVHIGSIVLKPFNTVVISNLEIIDDSPAQDIHHKGFTPVDTLFRAGKISGTFSVLGLFSKEGILFRRLEIADAAFHMVHESEEGWVQNYQRIFRTKSAPEIPVPGPEIMSIRKLKFRNFNFMMTDMVQPVHKGYGFDWQNLDLMIAELDAADVHLGGRKLTLDITKMEFSDKGNYGPATLRGRFDIGMGKFVIEDLLFSDSESTLSVPDISMSFKNAYAFKDFSRLVHFDSIVAGPSSVSGRTLTSVLGILPGSTVLAEIKELRVAGYVNNLNISSLQMVEKTSGTSLDLAGSITGLCNKPYVFLNSSIRHLDFTSAGISTLLSSLSSVSSTNLKNIAPGDVLHFSGKAAGPVNKLSVNGKLTLDDGQFSSKLEIRNLADRSHNTEIAGTAETDNFNIGRLIGNNALGECTARTGLKAVLVPGAPAFTIDSLRVDRLNALGYDYSGIAAKGKMTGKSFDGKIVCNDPNLNLLFQGICNFSTKTQNARYNFFADLGYADLKALKLDKRDVEISRASCHINANFLRIVKGDGIGDFRIKNIVLEDDKGEHRIGDVSIESRNNADGYRIKFNSSFAEGRYAGTKSIPGLLKDLKAVTAQRHIPSLFPTSARADSVEIGDYRMDFGFHDSRDLLAFIMPGLYIADSTALHLDLNRNGEMTATVESPRLALSMNYLRKSSIRIDNNDGSLNASVANDEIRAAGRLIHNAILKATAKTDSVRLDFLFEGKDRESEYGRILADGFFSRNEKDSLEIFVRPLHSIIRNNGINWDIAQSGIRAKGNSVHIDRFLISSDSQELFIDGGLSKSARDSLGIEIRNLELGMAEGFNDTDYGLAGKLNGQACIISPIGEQMQLFLGLICDSLEVGGHPMGVLALNGDWDRNDGMLDLDIKQTKEGRFPILAKGYIDPDENRLDFNVKLDNFDLAIIKPFAGKYISDPGGQISGGILASGSINSPEVRSNGLRLQDAEFKLMATGSSYCINGPISLNGRNLELSDISLTDENGGKGLLNGQLTLRDEESPYIDAKLQMHGLQIINLPEGNDNGLYGNLSTAGNVSVTGGLDDLSVSGQVSTFGPGNIHVPLNTANASSNSDLLTFRKVNKECYIDPYEVMISNGKTVREKHRGNISLNLNIAATPAVKAMLELNKSTGNVITANGDGNVVLEMETSTRKTNLTGDYIIRGGNFHFELPGIVKKEFALKDGSMIKFNGDVKNSTMDINAVYNLKTSLSTLLSDTTSVSTRRPVECTINIHDKLRNPQINFGINVPDLDPNSRTKMAEALNTDDKIQKQFIALLVMGTFLPNEQSGVINGTNILYSNVGEIMSNQLNNILQKLNIPLDLGLGYQQSQGGTDIFDVAISTQLFNNRVEIGGTVGNRQYKTSKNPYGDVVGDIDISIKLDKPGQFKLNLFSHSADEFTSFLDYSQRNGIGITYSKEYDNFWRLLKSIFSKKEKRREQEFRQTTAVEKEQTTIRIEQ